MTLLGIGSHRQLSVKSIGFKTNDESVHRFYLALFDEETKRDIRYYHF